MPTISFTRNFEVTREQYEEMLAYKPPKELLAYKPPKELTEALIEYRKNPYKEVTDPKRIREVLGEWGKE